MYILPSVMSRHSAKLLFAECLRLGTRQRMTPLIAWRYFAECRTLGKIFFAECFSLPSAWHSAKVVFTMCFYLPSVALGKESLCRVPDILHSAKPRTLGKDRVSGSECLGCLSAYSIWIGLVTGLDSMDLASLWEAHVTIRIRCRSRWIARQFC
jgi:hypothetical protein